VKVTLNEATPFATAATPADGQGRLLVQLISPGWGSSGYYSQPVLEAAAADKIWPAGTHMYLDHPTDTEEFERPGRSVRDLAAVTTEDARWDPTLGALVAEVRVFSTWRTAIADMAESIGVSIRGGAEGQTGEAEGRSGFVLSRLVEGDSVDFVTHAGRGGRVLQILESARKAVAEARNVGTWVESRIHRDFTVIADEMFGDGRLTREERITLSGAIGDALAGFVARLEADAPELYNRDLWEEPAPGIPAVSETVPTSPAGPPATANESLKEDNMATTQIEEARLRQLETDAGRALVLESERDTATQRAETAELALAESSARLIARPIVAAVLNAAETLHPVTRQRVIDAVVESVRVGADGALDTVAITLAATEARTNAEAEAAAIAETHGVGTPRGLGGHTSTDKPGDGISEAEYAQRLGLNVKGA